MALAATTGTDHCLLSGGEESGAHMLVVTLTCTHIYLHNSPPSCHGTPLPLGTGLSFPLHSNTPMHTHSSTHIAWGQSFETSTLTLPSHLWYLSLPSSNLCSQASSHKWNQNSGGGIRGHLVPRLHFISEEARVQRGQTTCP